MHLVCTTPCGDERSRCSPSVLICLTLALCAGSDGTAPCTLHIVRNSVLEELRHWPILAVIEGDIPAMSILMCLCGHTAVNACHRCCMPGVQLNSATRYLDSGATVLVPLTLLKRRNRHIHQLHAGEVAAGVPQGYLQISGGGRPGGPLSAQRRMVARSRLETLQVNRSTLGRLERHFTSDEMITVAMKADAITAEERAVVQVAAPLREQSPADRQRSWTSMKLAANTRHLLLGVTALPVFAQLPYFRCYFLTVFYFYFAEPLCLLTSNLADCCAILARHALSVSLQHPFVFRYENFCHFAVAHLFLLGLLKDFFSIWSDASKPSRRGDIRDVLVKDKMVKKAIFSWPGYIKQHLARRLSCIIPTRQWSMAGANLGR